MPESRGRFVLAGAAALAVLAAGCGGDDGGSDGSIPPDAAESMLEKTDAIEVATDNGECETAQATTTELSHEVEALPDGETKTTLSEMVSNLDVNLDDECPPEGTTGEEEEQTTTEPVETTTPVEPTTTTETTTTVPEEQPEEEGEIPEQPPGEGGGGQPLKPEVPGQGGGPAPPSGGVEDERSAPKGKAKPGKGDGKKEKG